MTDAELTPTGSSKGIAMSGKGSPADDDEPSRVLDVDDDEQSAVLMVGDGAPGTSLLSPGLVAFDVDYYAHKGDSNANANAQSTAKAAVAGKSSAVQPVSGKDNKYGAPAAAVLSKRKKEDKSVRASLSAVAR